MNKRGYGVLHLTQGCGVFVSVCGVCSIDWWNNAINMLVCVWEADEFNANELSDESYNIVGF